MPAKGQIESTMKTHFEAWNSGDRTRWIANWREDVVMADPVGGPEKQGRLALERSWDNSFQDGHTWRLEPIFLQICTDQAAVHVRNYGVLDGQDVVLDSIEIYWIDDEGKIFRVHTYFSAPDGVTLDPFFSPVNG